MSGVSACLPFTNLDCKDIFACSNCQLYGFTRLGDDENETHLHDVQTQGPTRQGQAKYEDILKDVLSSSNSDSTSLPQAPDFTAVDVLNYN